MIFGTSSSGVYCCVCGDAPGLVVYGLATVPMDIEVVVQLDHPRRTDLRLTLVDPNGSEAPLWDRTPELEATDRSFALEGSSAAGGIHRSSRGGGGSRAPAEHNKRLLDHRQHPLRVRSRASAHRLAHPALLHR